ncbi:hypothetical protein ACIBTP_29580 [Streptomyces avidinii]
MAHYAKRGMSAHGIPQSELLTVADSDLAHQPAQEQVRTTDPASGATS